MGMGGDSMTLGSTCGREHRLWLLALSRAVVGGGAVTTTSLENQQCPEQT